MCIIQIKTVHIYIKAFVRIFFIHIQYSNLDDYIMTFTFCPLITPTLRHIKVNFRFYTEKLSHVTNGIL